MKLSLMINEIMTIVSEKYSGTKSECFDIKQIRTLCRLYKQKSSPVQPERTQSSHSLSEKSGKGSRGTNQTSETITFSDIDFSTPDIKKIRSSKNKQIESNIGTPEFQKAYCLFIKILYSCLVLDVKIFDESDKDVITLKNNYQLIKSIEAERKRYVSEHIEILNKEKKRSVMNIQSYEKYANDYIFKIKILIKLAGWIDIFEKNDNLFALILPYFYTYSKYIEEYSG